MSGLTGLKIVRLQAIAPAKIFSRGRSSMRKILPIMFFAAAGSLVANTALAQVGQGDEAVIASDTEGALPVPEEWDCLLILPEYENYLDSGNAPEDWRYVGKTYKNVESNQNYDWNDWLRWADDSGCQVGALVNDQFLALPAAVGSGLGAVVGFLGAGLIAAVGGEQAKSPG